MLYQQGKYNFQEASMEIFVTFPLISIRKKHWLTITRYFNFAGVQDDKGVWHWVLKDSATQYPW